MDMARMTNSSFKGAITAEASMVLPIIVICILPFIFVFRMLLFQIVLENGVDECVKQMAIEMYLLERISVLPQYNDEKENIEIDQSKAEQLQKVIEEYASFFSEEEWNDRLQEWGYELAGEILFKQRLQKWLEKENLSEWGVEEEWDGIEVTESDFLYEKENHHFLISGTVSYEWEKVSSIWKPERVMIRRVYHCFVGENISMYDPDGKTEYSDEETVYCIGSGTKYHSVDCYLINKDVYTSTKGQAEMAGKQPCERCDPVNLITVYQTGGGDHYHTQNCSYLNPKVTLLTREEALRLGYTGCGLCWGGEKYFS